MIVGTKPGRRSCKPYASRRSSAARPAIINATPSNPVPHRHTHLSLPRPNRKQPHRPFTQPTRRGAADTNRHCPDAAKTTLASSTRSSLATHADRTARFRRPDHDAAAKP